jgi:predicted RecA/RadA family phage recombinase
MTNQIYTGTPTSRRFALCPTTVKAGDFVLLGTIPAVALDSYQSNTGGSTFLLNGTFALTVVGQTVESPQTTHKINPGDKLYATSGTLDATTNVTTGMTIDANSANTLIGRLDPTYVAVSAGATDTAAWVTLNVGAI